MKKLCFCILVSMLAFNLFCKSSKTEKALSRKEIQYRKSAQSTQQYINNSIENNKAVLQKYIANLPLEQKIAQMFIENLEGNTNFRSYETYDVITKDGNSTPLIAGGYLFFSYNLCDSKEQQVKFMNSIKTYALQNNQLPPYLSIDQEGGYVNRLRKLTGGLPSQEYVGQNTTIEECFELYSDQAVKMKELGFHMNIAPVIEVCSEDNKDFLDGRSFGDKEKVMSYGTACVYGYETNSIATVIKHFPGNTNTDPHTGLPEIQLSKDELFDSIESFKYVLDKNPSAILMSHARTSAIDSQKPACLSKVWVTDIIRTEYKYDGLIFSDDIFMGALADNGYPPEKAAIMAVEAGIDCIMTSEKRFGKQAKVIYEHAKENQDFADKIDKSVERILLYKINAGIINYEDLTL